METAVNYFAVFGGLNVKIDTTKPLGSLIKRHILDHYYDIFDEVSQTFRTTSQENRILTGIALGDRGINTSFKRAGIEEKEGLYELEELLTKNIITKESSFDTLSKKFARDEKTDKLIFKSPFIRFWFAFISPLYKGISREEYDEVYKKFDNYKNDFIDFYFEQLCYEYMKKSFEIKSIGRYWNKDENIELIAQTKDDEMIIGSCKYITSKIKKNELNRVKSIAKKLNISPSKIVIFSKSGFTNEMKSLKSDEIRLFTVKSLKALLD